MEYGENTLQRQNIRFPIETNKYVGPLQSQLDFVVRRRKNELQEFLFTMVKLDKLEESKASKGFFDFDYRGISGFQREIGSNLVKEGFIKYKYCSANMYLVNVFKRCFVGLDKLGMVYVLATLYDNPKQEAKVSMLLSHYSMRVMSIPDDLVIDVWNRTDEMHLYLKFNIHEEFINWLRNMNNLSNNSSNFDATVTAATTQQSPIGTIKVFMLGKSSENAAAVIHDNDSKAADADEMSALYGI